MIANSLLAIELPGRADALWTYQVAETGRVFALAAPTFEVDGRTLTASVAALKEHAAPVLLPFGVTEYRWAGALDAAPELTLELVLRVADDNPIVRWRVSLEGAGRLTKQGGRDALTYTSVSLADLPTVTEVQASQFSELAHSYLLAENNIPTSFCENELAVMGPILAASNDTHALLLAYEHGSPVPDAFAQFQFQPDRTVNLHAVKGSYSTGQTLPYETLWLQFGAVNGSIDALAAEYRAFVLHRQSPNTESRRPYIFYNTWAFQERNKWWNGKAYLDSMTQERILAEIDAAHEMGVEVFVLDTGWYEKTGDWRVNRARFPDGLRAVKAKLDGYGMKLGLWFDPLAAAISSAMAEHHQDCVLSWRGVPSTPHPVWETEESVKLCLVSRYAEAFATELIRLVREVGVTYFKWDAVGQYGCDSPDHQHGTAENTPEERADRYAFELCGALGRVVDVLCAACPEAIVDFDVTENGRSVGLQFLASGKYFLINNGPYSQSYDLPVPADGNVNLFFYPGPARAWVCRMPLTYDKWLPSVLFLTHYLPDDHYVKQGWNGPQTVTDDTNQWISLASLVLGQNGIWGDLLNVTPAGRARFGSALAVYKTLREDITESTLIRSGTESGSPEIYEKINPKTGRGVVSLFASRSGHYNYMTQTPVSVGEWHNDGVTVTRDAAGRALIRAAFNGPGAKLVFFGQGETL